jgi:hypothetical protein
MLTMLAARAAAPFLFGVRLAVALAGYLACLQFAPDLVQGLRASAAPRRMSAA